MSDGDRDQSSLADRLAKRRGWRDVLRRVYREFVEDRMMLSAAGVAFFAILAIFPGIAALAAIYGLLGDTTLIARQLTALSPLLPADAIRVVIEQLDRLAANNDESTLGLTFLISLLISLWSANTGMKAIFGALNIIRGETESRGFLRLNGLSLLFTLGAMLFVIATLLAIVALPVVLRFVGLERATEGLISVMRWPVFLVAVIAAITLVCRYGPSRNRPPWHWLSWGSGTAAALWIGISMLFSWYAANIADYNETYGSLGAIVGLMIWLWLSTMAILLGAAIDAELEPPHGDTP
jgi:membrane protein